MARLPQPGKDSGTWGDILNDFLTQAHNVDGSLKPIPQSKVTDLTQALADKADLSTVPTTPSQVGAEPAGLSSETKDTLSTVFVPKRVHFIGIIGQSNARGQGLPYIAEQNPSHPRIFQVPAVGANAHTVVSATDPLIMPDYPASVEGIGPGFQFARQWMKDLGEDDVIVLVGGAYGGTPLSSDVTLAWRYGVSGNLTAQFISQMQDGLASAAAFWPGAQRTIDGIIWVQGEQDGTLNGGTGTPQSTYQADLDALIAGLRSTFLIPRLPFIIGSMAPEYFSTAVVATIHAVHADTPYRVPFTGFALGSYGYVNSDNVHINDLGQRLAGRRQYEEFQRVRNGIIPLNPRTGRPTTPSDGYDDFNGIAISDTFSRTAAELVGSISDSGQAWEGIAGRFAVNGTRLIRHANLGTTSNRIKSTAIGDMSFSVTMRLATNLGASQTTRFNWSHQSETTGLRIQISGGSTATCQLILLKQGSSTVVLATWAAGTIPSSTAAADYVVTGTKNGPSVSASINGITVSATLTDEQAATIDNIGQWFAVSTTHPAGFELDNLTITCKGKRLIST